MNKFESKIPESPHGEHEELLRHYEDLENREGLEEIVECGPHVKEFEEMIAPLLEKGLLEVLSAIETEEEARGSEERTSIKKALIPLVSKMNYLKNRTDIEEDEFKKLYEQYKIISNAVGVINGGMVDHNR